MMGIEQSRRIARIQTELGQDLVVLERFSGRERLSEIFTFVADVIAPDGPLDFEPFLGTRISVSVQQADFEGVARSFNALLFEAEFISASFEGSHYRLVLKPWLELLDGNTASRIFQDKSVLDILKQLISEAGFDSSYSCDAQGSYPLRPYCVQFRESDFEFVSRLMEEEGIYYYFEHTDDARHVLHVCDATSQHPYARGLATTPYFAPGATSRAHVQPHLWQWDEAVRPGAGKVTLRDYNFLQPSNLFEASKQTFGTGAPAEKAELYDYPGGYGAYDVGAMDAQKSRYVSLRLEASRAERQRCMGHGDAFALSCGSRFTLSQYPDSRLNQEYLVIGTTHTLNDEAYRSGGSVRGFGLDVGVEAIPSGTQWRAPLRTPRPVAGGPQTATVVGPTGEVIYVDEYGRVKLQFHWDREGQSNEKSSCWIRVSQAWADAGFGTMLIPRIGEEVIVDFIDGDPDRPIVTGRVYNPQRNVPFSLPDDKTMSIWKSNTVGKSGPYPDTVDPPPPDNGYNEILFEDKGGNEHIFIRSQRDLNLAACFDYNLIAGHDSTVQIGHDSHTTVLTGNETHDVQQGSRTTTINQDDALEVKLGNSKTTVDTGDHSLSVNLGGSSIVATTSISLQVGDSQILMTPDSITIKASVILIDADTLLDADSDVTIVGGDTAVLINGQIVLIN